MKSYFLGALFLLYLSSSVSIVHAEAANGPGMQSQSTFLTGLVWDTQVSKVECGDNAAATWSANDFLYGTLGDCKSSFNLEEVGGTPYTSLTKTLTNAKIDGLTWSCCGFDGGKVKGSGILAIGNTLYVLGRNWDGHNGVGIAKSTDNGRTFCSNAACNSASHTTPDVRIKLGYPSFVNFGKGYAGGPSYVYIWGHGCEDSAYTACNKMHMLRVASTRIMDPTAYEVFISMQGGQPVWQATNPNASDLLIKAGSVFDCGGTGQCDRNGMIYNAPLGRYIAWLSDHNGSDDFRDKGKGGFGLYESQTPWDKSSWRKIWHTVCNTCGWDIDGDGSTTGAADDGIGDGGNFTTKWMSVDGKKMYMVYGGTNSLSIRGFTLTVNGIVPTQPPSTPTPTVTSTRVPSPSITPVPSGLPGDANGDRRVDGIDFSTWLANYNTSTSNGPTDGDFNRTGNVDGVDFSIWLSNYGRTSSPSPTTIASNSPTRIPTGKPPTAPNGFYVLGNKIYNPQNQPHIFRGIDRPSLEWDSKGINISLADFQKIRTWKANAVRLAVNQLFWRQDTNGYKARMQQAIAWIKEAGMTPIIDLHWSDRGTNSGAGQQKMPDTNSLSFWQDMARLYKNDGQVIFELYNEPHDVPCSVWQNGGTVDGWQASGMQQIYNAIRTEGSNNIVLIGGLNWAFDLTCVKTNRIQGYNIAYSTHPYNFSGKKTVADWESKVGFLTPTDPIVITEFGNTQEATSAGAECDSAFTRSVIEWAEQKGISWTAWAWYPGGCQFPPVIKDASGTPNANGRVVQEFLQRNN